MNLNLRNLACMYTGNDMTTTLAPLLDTQTLRALAAASGPCLTILLPEFHRGTNEAGRHVHLQNALRTAREMFASAGLEKQTENLLRPVERLAKDRLDQGGPGLALFLSAHLSASFDAAPRGATGLQVVLANHFLLTPFAAEASSPHDFRILGLSKKQLRWLDYSNGHCRELDLPPGVPHSLKEYLDFDPPEGNMESRAAAGPGTGAMGAVRFGTSAERDAEGEHLRRFFVEVDRRLKPALEGKLLLLMGVHEEIQAYRKATHYPHILDPEIQGNCDYLTLPDIAHRAAEAALAHHRGLEELALRQFEETNDPAVKLTDVQQVLQAAALGRVHRLCVRESAAHFGSLPAEVQHVALGEEDLVNAAVVQTLRKGGEVFLLPAGRMPRMMAALLRY